MVSDIITSTEIAHILVVEDEAIIGRYIQTCLEKSGFDVSGIVSTGTQAIQSAKDTLPDLVLMDIGLRQDLDGIEAASLIQEQLNIPVIYLTAHSDRATIERARATNPFGYITKPFDERTLQTTIEMALHKHRLEKELRESEARYRGIFQENQAPMLVIDPESLQVVNANPQPVSST